LAKEGILTYDCEIMELLPNATFRVKLSNNHIVVATASGKLRKNRIRCLVGDKCRIEISPYDLTRGEEFRIDIKNIFLFFSSKPW